jgi:hypothetical protein
MIGTICVSGYVRIYRFPTIAGIRCSLILRPFFLSLKNSEPFPPLIVEVRQNARHETQSPEQKHKKKHLEDVGANFPR